ncbi:hypothetical protein A1O1_01941, partial [Capronia coronata CBS 617.96]
DACCQAACVNVPCPSQTQPKATTACVEQCPQGTGTQNLRPNSTPIARLLVLARTSYSTSTIGSGATASSDSVASTLGAGADRLHVGKIGLAVFGLVIAGLAL